MADLTLTIRLHDPEEKQDHKKAASWVVLSIPREDLDLAHTEFIAKHIVEAIPQLSQFKAAK